MRRRRVAPAPLLGRWPTRPARDRKRSQSKLGLGRYFASATRSSPVRFSATASVNRVWGAQRRSLTPARFHLISGWISSRNCGRYSRQCLASDQKRCKVACSEATSMSRTTAKPCRAIASTDHGAAPGRAPPPAPAFQVLPALHAGLPLHLGGCREARPQRDRHLKLRRSSPRAPGALQGRSRGGEVLRGRIGRADLRAPSRQGPEPVARPPAVDHLGSQARAARRGRLAGRSRPAVRRRVRLPGGRALRARSASARLCRRARHRGGARLLLRQGSALWQCGAAAGLAWSGRRRQRGSEGRGRRIAGLIDAHSRAGPRRPGVGGGAIDGPALRHRRPGRVGHGARTHHRLADRERGAGWRALAGHRRLCRSRPGPLRRLARRGEPRPQAHLR